MTNVSNLRVGLPDYNTKELQRQWRKEGLAKLTELGELSVFRAMSVGTRQMLFQMCRAIGAKRVLDIGTYVGTSALNFALAVGPDGRVTTLDIVDANGEDGYWAVDKRPRKPSELMRAAGVDVEFVTMSGLDYLRSCTDRFDFVCIDAGKDADTDYEVAKLSVERMNPGGVLFFDDVFPNNVPMRPGGYCTEGPWLATERLKSEFGLTVHQINQSLDGGGVRCAFVTR
jgi:predicted O-methyltransferase YrrM